MKFPRFWIKHHRCAFCARVVHAGYELYHMKGKDIKRLRERTYYVSNCSFYDGPAPEYIDCGHVEAPNCDDDTMYAVCRDCFNDRYKIMECGCPGKSDAVIERENRSRDVATKELKAFERRKNAKRKRKQTAKAKRPARKKEGRASKSS